jgi:peptidoglycan/LPS O-acetylase OafA/YrhL
MLTIIFPTLIIILFFYQQINKKIGEKISLIGDISYSLYLIHLPIQILIFGILQFNNIKLDFNSKVYFLSYIITVTAISFLSYFYFEKSIQKFFRKNI